MTGPSTRRTLLQTGASALVALAGCTTSDSDNPHTNSQTATRTTTRTTDDTPVTRTSKKPTTRIETRPLSVSGAWPTFQFDAARTGYAPDLSGVPENGAPYWQVLDRSPAVVGGDTVYQPGEGRDSATGEHRWQSELPVGSSATVAEDTVLCTGFGPVAAFETDGTKRWTFDAGRGHTLSPAVVDGTVYVVSGDYQESPSHAVAVDLENGTERWRTKLGADVWSAVSVAKETLFVGDYDGTVYALDTADGTERWRARASTGVRCAPAVTNDAVYFADENGTAYALDPETGEQLWTGEATATGPAGGVAVTDDTLYVGGEYGVVALHTNDGSERWRVEVYDAKTTPPVVANDTVYAGASLHDRRLYALDAATGNERWTYRFPEIQRADVITGGVLGELAVVNGGLFVPAAGGLYAFGPKK